MAGGCCVHQLHPGATAGPEIADRVVFTQSLLRQLGVASEVLTDLARPLGAGDLLLVHQPPAPAAVEQLAALRCRKILVYGAVAPPWRFAAGSARATAAAAHFAGLAALPEIVDGAIAISQTDADGLRRRGFRHVAVIPLIRDFAAIRAAPHRKLPYYDAEPVFRLLCVGEIAPGNGQRELVEFAGAVRRVAGLPIAVVLAGPCDPADPEKRSLDHRIERLGLEDAVTVTGRIGDDMRFGWYRAADAYLSLGEPAGFAAPLVEAMALDLPVLAYAAPGAAEALGDAGTLLADRDPARILAALTRLAEDRRYRAATIRRQRGRVLRFGRDRLAEELRTWLAGLGIATTAAEPPLPGAAAKVHYVVEGPYESTYSLASVNRNLALALDGKPERAAHIEPAEGVEDYEVDTGLAEALPAAVRRLVGPAPLTTDSVVTIRNMYPPRPNGMLGDRRLVHLAWEESAITWQLAALMNAHLDAVLVPAEYCRRVLRNSGVRLPIAVIGHGVDHLGLAPLPAPDPGTKPALSSAAPFVFLHISAGAARKGIEELITAYCMAFSNRDPVLLAIKTYNNPDNVVGDWIEAVVRPLSAPPAIQVIIEDLHEQEIDILYDIADAVVLPARGEGFNLPAAEAMARGRPVIVTGHSGHMDFCNSDNALLLDFDYEASQSHLQVANSVWARARLADLVSAMHRVYQDGRSAETPTGRRVRRASRDAARLRWRDVGERIDDFVASLDTRPVMDRKLRLAWISTYNARCGIAAYSQHLIEHLDPAVFDVTILADNQPPVGPEPPNLRRLWKSKRDTLEALTGHLVESRYDIAFFQHNFGFYEFAAFARMLLALHQAGIATYVTLHRTHDLPLPEGGVRSLQHIAPALATCTRLFVHGIEDVNRLKGFGLTDNVVLLPHGVLDRKALDPPVVRQLLGLSGFDPVISTFGFLLPGKGLPALIHGLALLLRQYPNAFLLMLNSDYPDPASQRERAQCEALIRQLGLEPRTRLINDFLDSEEISLLLSASSVVVYPYESSAESDSGAVRYGLAAGRPVATTPLPVFSSLADIVHQLPGTTAADIAKGIGSLLGDPALQQRLVARQREWVAANSWPRQAERIGNLMRGCFEEARAVELCPPQVAVASDAPPDPELAAHLRAAQALLQRAPAFAPSGNGRIAPAAREVRRRPPPPALAPDPQPARESWGLRLKRKKSRAHVLADRARDARRWAAAAELYRAVLDDNPKAAPIWVQYGHALKESGSVGEAEAAYRTAIGLTPQNADSHVQLGHALKLQGRLAEAAAAYLRALALDPTLDHALIELYRLGWTADRVERDTARERLRLDSLSL